MAVKKRRSRDEAVIWSSKHSNKLYKGSFIMEQKRHHFQMGKLRMQVNVYMWAATKIKEKNSLSLSVNEPTAVTVN